MTQARQQELRLAFDTFRRVHGGQPTYVRDTQRWCTTGRKRQGTHCPQRRTWRYPRHPALAEQRMRHSHVVSCEQERSLESRERSELVADQWSVGHFAADRRSRPCPQAGSRSKWLAAAVELSQLAQCSPCLFLGGKPQPAMYGWPCCLNLVGPLPLEAQWPCRCHKAFLAHVLEKQGLRKADPQYGKFRSFLLIRLKGFLSDERDRSQAKKNAAGASGYSP